MKHIYFLCLFVMGFLPAKANPNPEYILPIELEKNFNFSYALNDENLLQINNKFGTIRVKMGVAKSLKIETNIVVKAVNKELAEKILSKISVISSKIPKGINAETIFKNMDENTNKDQNVKFEINYTVTMPATMGLDLTNKFGDVYLPPFTAPLNLNLSFCKLYAADVTHAQSSMKISYGQATVGKLLGTDIHSNFTNFNAEELRNVVFTDNYSELKAKILNDVKGTFNYSHGVFGNVKEGLKLKLNYSDDIKLVKIDEHIKNLEITTNFSDLELPLSKNFNGSFSIRTVNGSFMIDPAFLINYQKNTKTDNAKSGRRYSKSNVYEGNIGKTVNSNVKIIVISNFGDVKIND